MQNHLLIKQNKLFKYKRLERNELYTPIFMMVKAQFAKGT